MFCETDANLVVSVWDAVIASAVTARIFHKKQNVFPHLPFLQQIQHINSCH